ncbi:hypothetical protein DPMN_033322 [Dreissena polymorpha]|uniref:Uncharacterized protein n=1 Tax=Dreissena polymorpha TaxID=45954 RepID=A0A9D4M3K7_DREPO|nr:hypothetical protein DPMN_033322 [Dreissena polymorpha]
MMFGNGCEGQESVCDQKFKIITCVEKKTIAVAVDHSMVSKDSFIVSANYCV